MARSLDQMFYIGLYRQTLQKSTCQTPQGWDFWNLVYIANVYQYCYDTGVIWLHCGGHIFPKEIFRKIIKLFLSETILHQVLAPQVFLGYSAGVRCFKFSYVGKLFQSLHVRNHISSSRHKYFFSPWPRNDLDLKVKLSNIKHYFFGKIYNVSSSGRQLKGQSTTLGALSSFSDSFCLIINISVKLHMSYWAYMLRLEI